MVTGADAVINPVPDAETAARSYGALRPGGILVLSAVQPDEAAAMRRGVRATFVFGEATTGRLNELAALLDAGAIAPHVGMILPLAEARRAHALLDGAPHPGGKIVLHVLA